MPNTTTRESLTKGLEERFETQHAGGAFDAKKADGTALTDDFSNEFANGFTRGGLNTELPKKDSMMVKGLDVTRYAPGGRKP